MKNIRGHIAITVICVILGFVIAMQCKSVTHNNALTMSAERQRAEMLQAELNRERELNADLSEQLSSYRDDLEEFRIQAAASGSYAEVLSKQLTEAEILAGMAEVEGPGIIVTMNDSRMVNNSQYDPNLFIIHDEDILRVVNELRAAGAEALSINDERILATSEIRCAGATVSVNNTKYAAPFVIKAIGDPKTLEASLTMRGGIVEYLAEWGIEFNIVISENITVNAYTGSVTQKYARPSESMSGNASDSKMGG